MPPAHELSGLIQWARREDWRPHLEAVLAEHLGPAMDAFDISFKEIGDALGGGWGMSLWGCAFEDFVTRRFGPDGQNPVEDYLRRRGWKERPGMRSYMAALQASVMSLYEVSDIVPGQSLRARDLVRGGQPVIVSERGATQTLKTWDRIAARLVPRDDRTTLGGGLLAFKLEGSEKLLAQLRDHPTTATNDAGARNRKGTLKGSHGSDADLQRAAPLFTSAWLFDALPPALGTTPKRTLLNSDGDPIVFHTVNFPLTKNATADEIERRLNQLEQLRQASHTFWNWLGEHPPKGAAKPKDALTWNTTLDDGSIVLGNVELQGRVVALSVNSAARAKRGTALVAEALGDLAASPLTEIQTVEQMRAEPGKNQDEAAEQIPPEIKTRLIQELLERQYRELLDQPNPMLGNISAREAARTANGRKKLVVWLKQVENQSQHITDPDNPLATYDFTWLWRELGVEHLRN